MGLKHRYNYESVTASLKDSEKHYLRASPAGDISVALVFPNLYSLGMSNLGFLTVHRLLAEIPGVGVERFFPALIPEMPVKPPLYSFETGRPLGDFAILMFSFSYEGDFEKIPGIFAALGMPVRATERNRFHPVLIAGGAAVASNPAALSQIFDVIVPGEAETTVAPMMNILQQYDLSVAALAELPGVWVPSLNGTIKDVACMHDVNRQPAWSHIVAPENAFGGAHIVEVMRGCPRICSFCLARSIYAPARPVKAEILEAWLDEHPDCKDLGLVAPSLFDHPQVEEIFTMLADRQIRIRNSSVKWEKLTTKILQILRKSGIQGLTLAPETGSDRLRRAMNKPMAEDRFLDSIRLIFSHGFEHVKMYFVACLPGEDDVDADATVALISRVINAAPQAAAISAAFSVFVPKQGTAWANEAAPTLSAIKRRVKYLKEKLSRINGTLKVSFESPQEAVRQAYLSQVGPELVEEYAREAKSCREDRLFSRNQFSALEF